MANRTIILDTDDLLYWLEVHHEIDDREQCKILGMGITADNELKILISEED